MRDLPKNLHLEPAQLMLAGHSKDSHSYIMLHVYWFQCHCDLYRFLIPGTRESVSSRVFENTPPDYIEYCQKACLENALRLCGLWSDIDRLKLPDLSKDLFLPISIYQVSQIIHHLHQLLPAEGDHSLPRLQCVLYQAVKMASPLRFRCFRIESCLNDTEKLLRVLGQSTRLHPNSQAPQRKPNTPHLPSLHTLIPETTQISSEVQLPPFKIGSMSNQPSQGVSASREYNVPLVEASPRPGSQCPLICSESDSFDPWMGKESGLEYFDIFNMQLNGYSEPEHDGFLH
jgi:hypothetical protein